MPEPLHVQIADTVAPLYLTHNLTTTQIGARLNVSGTCVRDALEHKGIERRPGGRHGRTYLQPLDLYRPKHLYDKGLTIEQVADHLGISRTAARYRLLKAGVELRNQRGNPRA